MESKLETQVMVARCLVRNLYSTRWSSVQFWPEPILATVIASLLVNRVPGQVGAGTNLYGLATYRDLGSQ